MSESRDNGTLEYDHSNESYSFPVIFIMLYQRRILMFECDGGTLEFDHWKESYLAEYFSYQALLCFCIFFFNLEILQTRPILYSGISSSKVLNKNH